VISWRYHVVSIVAVLLAFGLGLLAGTTTISDRFVDTLQGNYDQARAELADARARLATLGSYVDESAPYLTAEQLDGASAVIVSAQGLDPGLSTAAAGAIEGAGGEVVARIRLDPTLFAPTAAQAQDLAATLGVPSGQAASAAAELLGRRLAAGPSVRGANPDGDLLEVLFDGGFIGTEVEGGSLEDVGLPGQIVVVVASGTPEVVAPAADGFLLPLTTTMIDQGALVGAAEATPSTYGFVPALRDDDVTDRAVLVDDLDLEIGRIALAMGMGRLREDPVGGGGDYGVGGTSLIPPFPEASATPTPAP
jgi:hypothetical protein